MIYIMICFCGCFSFQLVVSYPHSRIRNQYLICARVLQQVDILLFHIPLLPSVFVELFLPTDKCVKLSFDLEVSLVSMNRLTYSFTH